MCKLYDHIVAMGTNCEVSHQLQRHFGFFESGLFARTFIDNNESVIKTLSNLEEYKKVNLELTEMNMYKKVGFGVSYHATNILYLEYHSTSRKPKDITQYEKLDDIMEVQSKINHFVEKITKLVNSDERTLFIYKPQPEQKDFCFTVFAARLKIAIKQLQIEHKDNFDLLIVFNKQDDCYYEINDLNRVYTRGLDYFPPDGCIQASDNKSWDNIFSEFKYKKEN